MIAQYPGADQAPAHPGRIGGVISPRGIIVHTTDTLVGSKPAIVKSWQTTRGQGNAANVIIGADGKITQLIDFTRNANHAGGVGITFGGLSPNLVNVGIEMEAPGYLAMHGDHTWIHTDTGHVFGESQVYNEPTAWGVHRAWGLIPDVQLAALAALLDWLRPQLDPRPLGALVHPGTYLDNGVIFGEVPADSRITGHVTSNPIQKTDPGPQVMTWLADHGYLKP